MPYSAPGPFLGAQTASAYQISRSLRFRSSASAYLSRTFTTPTDNKKWSMSMWAKRGVLGSDEHLFSSYTDGNNYFDFRFNSSNQLYVQNRIGASNLLVANTTAVYRDPSAWYHILFVFDSANATAAYRNRIYVNGIEYSLSANSGSGDACAFNKASATNSDIGVSHTSGLWGAFDGYLAEVNFIDGQALTPSSFGAFDTNGVWQPKAYTGTYGTNGFYLPFTQTSTSSYAANTTNGYVTAPSNAAFAVGTNNFTMELWFYPTSGSQNANLFFALSGGIQMGYQSTSSWGLAQANVAWQLTTSTLPTTNAWNHMVVVRSGTGTNQTALFLNGTRVAQGTISTSYSQNSMIICQSATGYVSNARLVNGTAIYNPSSTSITVPTAPLTNVAGTAVLTFQNSTAIDNSSNAFTLTQTGTMPIAVAYPFGSTITNDQSGLGNNWTSNNISTFQDTTYDSMYDSPTNYADGGNGRGNYCVLSPLDIAGTAGSITDGNLKLTGGSAAWYQSRCGFGMTSGKWYWEVTILSTSTSSNGICIGIANSSAQTAGFGASNQWIYNNNSSGRKSLNGTSSAYGVAYVTNDIVGVAFDADAGTLTFYVNNSSQGTAASSGLPNPAFPVVSCYGTDNVAINFGQRPFTYTPPSGFSALNTQNLPTPTIAAGNKYFDATTYGGDSASPRSFTNSGTFQPDLVWIKNRTTAGFWNVLFDSVRGVGNQLASNQTDAELASASNVAGKVSAFNVDGFSVLAGSSGIASVNATSNNYVAWQWKAGGTGVSNTSGSITSTVSANTSAGFSVVTYTGTLSAAGNATVGHGLGVAPSLIISKSRSAAADWCVQIPFIAQNKYLVLNTTVAQQDSIAQGGGTLPLPNSTTFGTSYINGLNISGQTFVAYCFAPVAGYSAAFSYTGNGSTDGPMVYLGFRPRFVLIKCSSTAPNDWVIYDTTRNTYNATINRLFPDLSDAESTGAGGDIDVLSNGLKIRSTYGNVNASGGSYIGYAIAENPFKVSRAR